MLFITFVRCLPARIARGITMFAEAVAEARALQMKMARKHPQGFDS